MKKIKQIAILGLAGALVWSLFFNKKPDVQHYKDKIDSLKTIIDIKSDSVIEFKLNNIALEWSVEIYMAEADSLNNYIKTHNLDCCGQLKIREEENIILRKVIATQDSSRVFYKKTIHTLESINVDSHAIILTSDQMNKIELKSCKRNGVKRFFQGMGVGGVIVLVLVLL